MNSERTSVTSNTPEQPLGPLDYAGPGVGRPTGGTAVATCFCAFTFLLSAVLYVQGRGLHNDLHADLLVPWVITGIASVAMWFAGRRQPVRFPHHRWARRVAAVVFFIGLLSGGADFLGRLFGEDPHARMRCLSNLRQIAQGVQIYANDHRGQFPPTVEALLVEGDLTSDVFVCYATNDTRADGPTTRAIADQFAMPGHMSYVYTGRGLDVRSPPTAVLAYEPPANHQTGGGVMFSDGHAEWLEATRLTRLIDELNAGHNPPRPGRVR